LAKRSTSFCLNRNRFRGLLQSGSLQTLGKSKSTVIGIFK